MQPVPTDRIGGLGGVDGFPMLLAIHGVLFSVSVPVVQIRVVWVIVGQRLVHVRMRVRLAAVPQEIMGVLVMFVVPMAVVVRQRRVGVFVRVTLADVQPHAQRHQRTGQPEGECRVFGEQQQR